LGYRGLSTKGLILTLERNLGLVRLRRVIIPQRELSKGKEGLKGKKGNYSLKFL